MAMYIKEMIDIFKKIEQEYGNIPVRIEATTDELIKDVSLAFVEIITQDYIYDKIRVTTKVILR